MASQQTFVVDLIHTTGEIGELTKLGVKLGYDVHIEPAHDENVPGHQVRFTWRDGLEYWGEEHLVNVAMLVAFAKNLSGNDLLERVRKQMDERCYPLEQPIQDVMSIGTNHDDHDGCASQPHGGDPS